MKRKPWHKIDGWFDFAGIYRQMVRKYRMGGHFVEVGIFRGRSTVFMAKCIENHSAKIQFDAIDIFGNKQIEAAAMRNLRGYNVNVVKSPSVQAASQYQDKSLDFVFIDADHRYQAVKADVLAWLPKVKDDGFIAGHDYRSADWSRGRRSVWPGVKKAVDEIAKKRGLKVQARRTSWFINLSHRK